jgi:hypothetical protein
MTKFRDSVYFKPVAMLLASVMFFGSVRAASPAGEVILTAGTPIPLELATTITSKSVASGTIIDFRVLSDVKVDGKIVVPAGSLAKGQVSRVKKNSMFGGAGELDVAVKSVTAVDGTNIFLSASSLSDEGDSKVVISVVLFVFCLFGFLIKGGSAEIPAGTQCTATVGSNTSIAI